MPTNRQNVIIIGGGVAGLTAAHELIERDFDVTLYERRESLGGKAASVRVRRQSDPGALPEGTPGEHGFRFFPGWYRHLPDTLKRIPLSGHRHHRGERTVFDRLVATESNLLARYTHRPIPVVLHSPTNKSQLLALFEFVKQLADMGLPLADIVFFLKRLAVFLRTPEGDRARLYDRQSWWTFLQADQRSEAFRTLTIATTRTLIAAKAEAASAFTIAQLAIRTLFAAPLEPDRVLDGPTSEVWIEPWRRFLAGRGVQFKTGYELESVNFDGSGPQIASLTIVDSQEAVHIRQLRGILAEDDAAAAFAKYNEYLRTLEQPPLTGTWTLDALQSQALAALAVAPLGAAPVTGDFYIFAIPVEQMAYYVNRSTTMRSYAPDLRNIVRLSASIDWMAGIQFYLQFPLQLAPGHIVCADSEWALTAIEQTQFWRDVDLPNDVQSIISVDISAWDKKGRFLRKEAFMCTKDEIALEVWNQLKASFNRPGETEVLKDTALRTGALAGSYYVDDNIVERFDRKKQAMFAQSIDRAISRVEVTALGAEELLEQAEENPDAPFVFGDRLEMNVEPLLVNRPGSHALRPSARTKIVNMFLAADYVATATDLACMEGANEAARVAVNGILDAVGSKQDRCRTWALEDGQVPARMASLVTFAERLPGARTSVEAATSAVATFGSMAARATSNLRHLWKKT